jgi:tellurite resistance protein
VKQILLMGETMSKDQLGDRAKAMEESFFAKQNEALRQRLRESEETQTKKQALSAASGITDDALLDKLVALNLQGETLAALSLVPLVVVAWADGHIDSRERAAVLSAANSEGLHKEETSYQLLEQWLANPPPPDMLVKWRAYIQALSATLDNEARQTLKSAILDRAREIANVAGGFLGIGSRVAKAEKVVLEDLARSFL